MTYLFLKVLNLEMQSCNDGKLRWKLNAWQIVSGNLVMCSQGLHLTTEPSKWAGRRIFIAETSKVYGRNEDKRLCRRVRLLKELSPKELAWYEAQLKPIYEAYEAQLKPIDEAYRAQLKPIDEAYRAQLKPIDEAYDKKITKILKVLLDGKGAEV
jgi:hypothetical protein